MKNLKGYYIIFATFIAGIITKILFLKNGDRKETKKTIKNMKNKIKIDRDEISEFDKNMIDKLEEIKGEENEEKRLNNIADLFRD